MKYYRISYKNYGESYIGTITSVAGCVYIRSETPITLDKTSYQKKTIPDTNPPLHIKLDLEEITEQEYNKDTTT